MTSEYDAVEMMVAALRDQREKVSHDLTKWTISRRRWTVVAWVWLVGMVSFIPYDLATGKYWLAVFYVALCAMHYFWTMRQMHKTTAEGVRWMVRMISEIDEAITRLER